MFYVSALSVTFSGFIIVCVLLYFINFVFVMTP